MDSHPNQSNSDEAAKLVVGYPPKREWVQVDVEMDGSGLQLKNEFGMRVAHWNILAGKLADKEMFVTVSQDHLDWSFRFQLITAHLLELNADILGISEFDCLNKSANFFSEDKNKIGKKAHTDLKNFLTFEMGYADYIIEKDSGLSASAIFYKKDKFQCIAQGKLNLDYQMQQQANGQNEAVVTQSDVKDGKYGLLYCHFQLKDGNTGAQQKEFIFAETHLKAMDDFRFARVAQAAKITEYFKQNFKGIPMILAGDFNDFPLTDPLNKFDADFVDLYSLKTMQEGMGDDGGSGGSGGTPVKELLYPEFTLICDTKKSKVGPSIEHRCLDYIMMRRSELAGEGGKWINGAGPSSGQNKNDSYGILINKYLALPERQYVPTNPEEVAHLTIPGPLWASDHFSLAYDIRIWQVESA